MRQAGRYMKEYRDIREKVGFLELCKRPDLASEVTVTAAHTIGADAAIIFADILLITEPLGFKLEFPKNDGPIIHNPFKNAQDLSRLQNTNPKESLSFVMKALQITKQNLKKGLALIGFAGAPFTVASYAIEGGSSKNFEKTKVLMRSDGKTWNAFLDRIANATSQYLLAQIEAGADAIQLFDSWVGTLNPLEFQTYVLPHVKKIFRSLPSETPKIYFGAHSSHLLSEMKQTGASVLGLDFHVELGEAWKNLKEFSIQGNLDPTVLLCDPKVIEKETKHILDQASRRAGHIFNLGHGVLPATNVDHVKHLIDFVHDYTSK